MTTRSRIGRVTHRTGINLARAGQGIARMARSVPAGTFDPAFSNAIRITISNWWVKNNGTLAGFVGGHIIVQSFSFPTEVSIVEGDWVEDADPFRRRLRTSQLKAEIDTSNSRRRITWAALPILVGPGVTKILSFDITIGMDLIESYRDLDIVAIVDRLPEADGIAEDRAENAFSVSSAAPQNFMPTMLTSPVFDVGTA